MKYPLLIPKISEKIERLLKELKLKPEISPQKFIKKTKGEKHRYSSLCFTKEGEKLIFYARLFKSLYEKERMLNEIRLAKIISKEISIGFFPRYFSSGTKKDFEWFTREYFQAGSLERTKKIEKLKRELKKEEIEEIVKALLKIANFPLFLFPFLKKFDLNEYFGLPRRIGEKEILTKEEIKRLENLLKENKEVLEKENKYFSHGDFQIGNILISKSGLKIIDLESIQINNFAFDLAFLTTRLWQDKKIRKKIIESYQSLLPKEKNRVFPILFRINTFYIAYHTFMSNPIEYSSEMLKKRKNFYLKLMKSCLNP